ncbi:MAG: hypothetical protein AAF694_30035, partial [Bacteroidota bacterium]
LLFQIPEEELLLTGTAIDFSDFQEPARMIFSFKFMAKPSETSEANSLGSGIGIPSFLILEPCPPHWYPGGGGGGNGRDSDPQRPDSKKNKDSKKKKSR